ncbi:MAG: hypothetical protein QW685_05210 [Saccharolobus sp.]
MSVLFRSMLNLKPGSQVAVYEGPKTYRIYEVQQLMPFNIVAPITLHSNENSLTIDSKSQYIPNAEVKDPATGKPTPVSIPNPLYAIATLSQFTAMLIMGIAWDSPSVVLTATDPAGAHYWHFKGYDTPINIYIGDKMYAPEIFFAAFAFPGPIPTFSFSRNYNARNVDISFNLYLYGYIVKYKGSVKTASDVKEIFNLPLIYLYSPVDEVYSFIV